jgi:hypothetical protein
MAFSIQFIGPTGENQPSCHFFSFCVLFYKELAHERQGVPGSELEGEDALPLSIEHDIHQRERTLWDSADDRPS